MFEIIKSVIKNKNFELKDILYKINKMWIESAITEEEKAQLDELARENANTDNSIDMLEKIKEQDLKIKDIEARLTKLENGETENPEEPTEPFIEYPNFVKDKWYYKGDKITYNGKKYICIAPEGQVCVWSPDEYGTYWEEVVEETIESEN